MNLQKSYVPTELEIDAAALRILNEGGYVCKEHFVELLDQWIDEQEEYNYNNRLTTA